MTKCLLSTEKIPSIKDINNIISISSFFNLDKNYTEQEKFIEKPKKRVTIKNDIDIIYIEDWKKFNIDVSITGGCAEWDIQKCENDIYEFENEMCNIF